MTVVQQEVPGLEPWCGRQWGWRDWRCDLDRNDDLLKGRVRGGWAGEIKGEFPVGVTVLFPCISQPLWGGQ